MARKAFAYWLAVIAASAYFSLQDESSARILPVPSVYSTIQLALEAVGDEDTVLVDTGVYFEFLHAPPITFVLMGNSVVDSTGRHVPTLDPSGAPLPRSVSCMIIPETCSLTLENFRLVNGAAMYPRGNYFQPGGIAHRSSLPLNIRHCIFDSVFCGVYPPDYELPSEVSLFDCDFFDTQGAAAYSNHAFTARQCRISGNVYAGFGGRLNVEISDCQFSGTTQSWIGIYGSGGVIENCSFGPGICERRVVNLRSRGDQRIEHNTFNAIGLSESTIDINFIEGSPVIIRNNLFTNNYLRQFQYAPIRVDFENSSDPPDSSFTLILDHNTFAFCSLGSGQGLLPKILQLAGRCEVQHNYFIDNVPAANSVIRIGPGARDQIVRDNVFINNGLAIADDPFEPDTADARWNYWGDSTGPYHPFQNPFGLGDEVDDNVLFAPWYPDTSFLETANQAAQLPDNFTFDIFPNPFNSETRVIFALPAERFVDIAVYNILGQRVATVVRGLLAGGVHRYHFIAADLASGDYFVRLSAPPINAVKKLVVLK